MRFVFFDAWYKVQVTLISSSCMQVVIYVFGS